MPQRQKFAAPPKRSSRIMTSDGGGYILAASHTISPGNARREHLCHVRGSRRQQTRDLRRGRLNQTQHCGAGAFVLTPRL